MTISWRSTPFFILLVLVLFLNWSPAISLMAGLVVGLFFEQPYASHVKKTSKYLLQFAIVGLGFGMDFHEVLKAGSDGFVFTLLSLSLALMVGYLLGRWLHLDRSISYLISVGTAICGGSAIAAVSQSMKADERTISVSIGIVFILNAVALLAFPFIGEWFHLTQHQFGLWAAIAIHDTSSVVGAASHYGNEALGTATTVKLARALWIIPMTLATGYFFQSGKKAAVFPWFILMYVAASVLHTYFPFPESVTAVIIKIAKMAFSITLFFIGSGISRESIRSVGVRPLLHGIILWVLISVTSLIFLLNFS